MDEFRTGTSSSAPSAASPQGMRPARPPQRNRIVWLIILLIIFLAFLWLSGSAPAPQENETSTEIAPGQMLTEVPEGSVIAAFPKKLILEDDVVAQASYAITYTDGNLSQPVLSYRSARTLQENIDAYGAYLSLNSWNVTHEADASETPVTFFYAAKENNEVNITFAPGTEGVLVTIAYVTKGE